MKLIKKISLSLIILLIIAIACFKSKYGGGKPYPDQSSNPIIPEEKLERIIELDLPPGNIGLSKSGRIFFNYHPFAKAERFGATVFELVDGQKIPFPSEDYQKKYQAVFGMSVDKQDRIWFIEPAGLDFSNTNLLAFDIHTKEEVFRFSFPPKVATFAQDLRITSDGKKVILADTGFFKFTDPGLILLDVESKKFKTFLSKHESTKQQDWVMKTPFGEHKLGYGLVTFTVGLDGIEMNEKENLIYIGAMSHDSIYKFSLSELLNPNATDESIIKTISKVGKKPLSDGITLDKLGNILITDVENGGIARMNAVTGKLETIVKSSKIIWADGIVYNEKTNQVIFTDSAIPAYIHQLALPPSKEKFIQHKPFGIYKFQLN